jgi:hypothetical protein
MRILVLPILSYPCGHISNERNVVVPAAGIALMDTEMCQYCSEQNVLIASSMNDWLKGKKLLLMHGLSGLVLQLLWQFQHPLEL